MITAALSLGAGVFNAVSSGFSFFSSGNYVKLVKEAGTGAVATLKTAGQESRATIEKIDVTANNILQKMGSETRSVLQAKEKGIIAILEKAKSSANDVIASSGKEVRHSSQYIKMKADQILDKASRESELVLEKAGMEARTSIQYCGKEARDTCLLLNAEMGRSIHMAGDEAQKVLSSSSQELKSVIDLAKKNIQELNGEITESCLLIMNESLEKVDSIIHKSIQSVDTSLANLIKDVEKVAKGVILDFGDQGRLFVQDTGKEIRATADAVLAKAFAGQEAIIKCCGTESKLLIAAAGKEMRSTLYVLPRVASKTAAAAAQSFMHEVKNAFWSQSEVSVISHLIKNYCTVSEDVVPAVSLIEYVKEQNQIQATHKCELYKLLVQIFNDPSIEKETRLNAHLLIGAAALLDDDLIEQSYCGWHTTGYSKNVIMKIPGTANEILCQEGARALDRFLPRTIELPKIEFLEPNPLALKLEQEHLLSLEWQNRSLELQREVELLKLENEENVRFLQEQFVQKHSEELSSQEIKLKEVQTELIRPDRKKGTRIQAIADKNRRRTCNC